MLRHNVRNWLAASLKIALSAILLFFVARNVDTAQVGSMLESLTFSASLATCVLLLAVTLITSLRWWLVMVSLDAPLKLGTVTALMFIGTFFSQVLPTSIGGDAVRIWQARNAGISYERAISGVFLERVSGLVGLVLMIAVGMIYMGSRIDIPALRYGLLATLPLCLVGIVLMASLDRLPVRLRRWNVMQRLLAALARLAADTRAICVALPAAPILLILSLSSHVLAGLALYALADGLGLSVTVWECLALLPSVILFTLIPISFAGWGLREGAMVTMFAFAGVATEAALAISVLFGLALLITALPGWLLWLGRRSTTPDRNN